MSHRTPPLLTSMVAITALVLTAATATISVRSAPTSAAFSSSAVVATELSAGPGRSMAFLDGGQVACGIDLEGFLWCWGANPRGALGDGTRTDRLHPVRVQGALATTKVKSVAVNGSHTCAITQADQLYCWGPNEHGGVGNNTLVDALLPVRVSTGSIGNKAVTDVAVRGWTTCAVTSDGGGHCWGFGVYGRLGTGDATGANSPVPKAVNATGALAGKKLAQIAVGTAVCAIDTAGKAYCWGNGLNGAMGNNTSGAAYQTNALPVATYPTGSTYVQIESAGNLTCARTSVQAVYCWGRNMYGMAGTGDPAGAVLAIPKRIKDSGTGTFKAVDVGVTPEHICVADIQGAVWCSGRGVDGQLGNGALADSIVPVKVADGGLFRDKIISVSGSSGPPGQTCALDASGYVYCWGAIGGTGLGDGNVEGSRTPVRVQRPW